MRYRVIQPEELGLPAQPERTGGELRAYLREDCGLLGDAEGRWAVIICPGGGYWRHGASEDEPVALAFLSAGVQAFVLHYSVKPARYPMALTELAAAVAWIRDHGPELGVAPSRIAVCGFSAGGHLAGCLANLWASPALHSLGRKAEELRPDAVILGYPVISAGPEFGHLPSFRRLLGDGADIPPELSLENSVTGRNPPAFLWTAMTDDTVPPENTMAYAAALRRAGVPFELHLYGDGSHAMGLATVDSAFGPEFVNNHVATWHGLCVDWLRRLP